MSEHAGRRREVWLPLAVLLAFQLTYLLRPFPFSPEDWTQQILLRERSLPGSLLPFDQYTYYRPLWFAWLALCDRLGPSATLVHAGTVAAHLGGVLALLAFLLRAGCARPRAVLAAALAGLAPGTAGALAWVAAGNKAFTFCALAVGALLVQRVRSLAGVIAIGLFGSAVAVGCSENAYLLVLLWPAVALAARRRRDALLLAGLGLLVVAVHLFLLSPQSGAGEHDRVAQLRALVLANPLAWGEAVAGNLGRYFLYGLGLADDAPLVGALALLGLSGLALTRRVPGLAAALVTFFVLNVPASGFPGESSRHHAYLPALGAGLVLAALLARVRGRAAAWLTGIVLAWCVVHGWRQQDPWVDYLQRADRAFTSSRAVFDEPPPPAGVTLLNVPEEYRAAFRLWLGADANVGKWPAWTILATRTEILLPPGAALPADTGGFLLEYDGSYIRQTSWATIARRERSPLAWLAPSIDRFEHPAVAWSEIVGHAGPLRELHRSFHGAPQPSQGDLAAGRADVLAHGGLVLPKVCYWEVRAELPAAGWLVLGWLPLGVPATQNAWIFQLTPLPWLFRVEVQDLGAGVPLSVPVQPVLGLLPALWLEPGSWHLRVELALRG